MPEPTPFPSRSSWLRTPDTTDPAPPAKVLQDESRSRLGYVRNFLKLPIEADRLSLFQGYINRLMRGDDCQLSGQERELTALIVSLENRCEPCVITHAAALEAHGMAKRTVDLLLVNWRRAPLDDRMAALAQYASDLTLDPGSIEPDDLDELREAGLSELEILEAAQIVAIFNATNRLNSGLGIRVDEGAHEAFRR
ncbi:MAG: peroxidase-related enzyme [Pseudomonadota bacterium]